MGTTRASAEISFNTAYAEYQHEHTELHHPEGGKSKYLEGPIKQYSGAMEPYIAERIKKKLEEERPDSAEAVATLIESEMEDAIGAFAEIVGGAAVKEAPLREGTLRGSMEVYTDRGRE